MFPLFYGCHVGGAEHGDSILGSVLMPQSTVGFLSSFLIELNDIPKLVFLLSIFCG